jgi:hypothetical protein
MMRNMKLGISLLALLMLPFTALANPGTAFSYQGRLADGSTPIETPVDLRFSLWDTLTTGSQIGGPGGSITFLNTAYDGGIITQSLDFGAGAFNGDPRFLQIELANPASSAFTLLSGRIELKPAPYSIYSETAGGLLGGSAFRTPIESLPFTITTPGSYYLARHLVGAIDTTGITVSANNVTIDLNGFSLVGGAGSTLGDGINISGAFTGLRVHSGIVQGWGEQGIDASLGSRGDFFNLLVGSNGVDGILLGPDSSVKECKIERNADGIETANHCVVIDNDIIGNTSSGVRVSGEENVIEENDCTNNATGIIIASVNGVIKNNRTIGGGTGLNITGTATGNVIAGNYSSGNNTNHNLGPANNEYDLLLSDIPFTMNVPGKITLTGNLVNRFNNADGITIDTDNVTVDLNGFTLFGGRGGALYTDNSMFPRHGDVPPDWVPYTSGGIGSDDGIVILGNQENITIRNGAVVGWGGDGINALNADQSLFEDLFISANDGQGLIADFNCIVHNCSAIGNVRSGIRVDDGSVIQDCVASENGENGIETSEGCVVTDSSSYFNNLDGFDVSAGTSVMRCSAGFNGGIGFDVSLGGGVTDCVARRNGDVLFVDPTSNLDANGFDMASACNLFNVVAIDNAQNGIRTFANSFIRRAVANNNDEIGIRISSTDGSVLESVAINNDFAGIAATSSGGYFASNRAAFNNEMDLMLMPAQPFGNFDILGTSAYGPIIDVSAGGDLTTYVGADHPKANFSYSSRP